MWYPQALNQTNASALSLGHSQGLSTMTIDQTANGARWVLVGEFAFGEPTDSSGSNREARAADSRPLEQPPPSQDRFTCADSRSAGADMPLNGASDSSPPTSDWMSARRAHLSGCSSDASPGGRQPPPVSTEIADALQNYVIVSPGVTHDGKSVVADTVRLVFIPQ